MIDTDALSRAKELEQGKETLHAAATAAFLQFQQEIAAEYEGLRNVAVRLATFDCLLSFAIVAAGEGYSRPEFVTESSVAIRGGRHPMVRTSSGGLNRSIGRAVLILTL
jgi:DNA mismatch repair protein MSH3